MNAMAPDPLATLRAISRAPNLADSIPAGVLGQIGQKVIEYFEVDKASMADWCERMDRALDTAMLVKDKKTYPWTDAANIRYPLITSAALQYNARAYPAIVPGTDIVKVAVYGADQGTKAARSRRVSEFMTWQLTVDSREWERGTDQLLLQLPIIGDAFRKLWWEGGKLRSQIRLPGRHVVVNNNATTLEAAPRVSDIIQLYPHQVETAERSGRFVQLDIPRNASDAQAPETFIEQLCRHDLDGDGYDEPYIITVHRDTQKVARVVAAWDDASIRTGPKGVSEIAPVPYLVHYQFMPAMDGGFFGTGMGLLLGDISDTIDGALNMIMDSGHLASLGGGFIAAQNFRIKGGAFRLKPGEYKMVNAVGDDIRKGVVPLDFPGPSPVLFQVLGMMIEAGREITSVSNVMTGDMGRQNMPVGTVMALIEQGQMVFTASYKRIYRSMQDEFGMIARLNGLHLLPEKYQAMLDEPADPQADFNLDDMDIQPVADPKAVTSMQRMGRAQFVLELAKEGAVDRGEAIRRVLDAANIEEPEALMPKPDPVQAMMLEAQGHQIVNSLKLQELEIDQAQADIMETLARTQKTATEAELAPVRAKIDALKAMRDDIVKRREQLVGRGIGGMAGASHDAKTSGSAPGRLPAQQGSG